MDFIGRLLPYAVCAIFLSIAISTGIDGVYELIKGKKMDEHSLYIVIITFFTIIISLLFYTRFEPFN